MERVVGSVRLLSSKIYIETFPSSSHSHNNNNTLKKRREWGTKRTTYPTKVYFSVGPTVVMEDGDSLTKRWVYRVFSLFFIVFVKEKDNERWTGGNWDGQHFR